MDAIRRLMGEAIARHVDFQLWYLALEEHYKRGIEGIVKDMVWSMRPKWIPSWLWRKCIREVRYD